MYAEKTVDKTWQTKEDKQEFAMTKKVKRHSEEFKAEVVKAIEDNAAMSVPQLGS